MTNILKKCTFIDRKKSTITTTIETTNLVNIDEIIEERFSTSAFSNSYNNNKNRFYLILYLNADWLPEIANKNLNKKLAKFYENYSVKKCFEFIFISSDKDNESNEKFLQQNEFIRYSFNCKDADLKVNLLIFLLHQFFFSYKILEHVYNLVRQVYNLRSYVRVENSHAYVLKGNRLY